MTELPIPAVLTRRRDDLDPHRVESRVAAYVYGDVLVLAAVVGVSEHSVGHGTAFWLVLTTVASTYIAHVLAHSLGVVFGGGDHEEVRHTLRDAVPIISSGAEPAAVLLLAWFSVIPELPAQILAAVVPLVRIAGVGFLYRRLQAEVPVARAIWVGLISAAVALVVVLIKLAVAH